MARLLSSARDIVPSGGTHKIIYSRLLMFLFLNKRSNSVEKSISAIIDVVFSNGPQLTSLLV